MFIAGPEGSRFALQPDMSDTLWSMMGTPSESQELTMTDQISSSRSATDRQPWNKDKLIGAKPPLRLKHFWAIRSR